MHSAWSKAELRTLITLTCLTLLAMAAQAGKVHVAVSANFADTQERLAEAFTESSGHAVLASGGSTGKLFTQIVNGAPFDVFLSADEEHITLLGKKDLVVEGSRFTYATGRLAVYAPVVPDISSGGDALRTATISHLAIANPKTAPYGAAAVSALKQLDLWELFQGRLVYGENISQAMQFVESGGAEVGFVAYSQVIKCDKKDFWLVPETLHAPLKQDAALLRAGEGNAAAASYLTFLKSADARRIITSMGYSVQTP